jgi:hypothetical protein
MPVSSKTNKDIIYSTDYTNTNWINEYASKHYVDSSINISNILKEYSTKEILDELDIREIQLYLRNIKLNKIKNKIK